MADLLEVVERFEIAVEARGGNLMVDEPANAVPGAEPDDLWFVLPLREPNESVAALIERIEVGIDVMTERRRSASFVGFCVVSGSPSTSMVLSSEAESD